MDSFKQLYSNLFQHSLRRTIYVVAGLIVALSLPITIILTQQQQDLRQRASGGEASGSNFNNNWGESDGSNWGSSGNNTASNCSTSTNRGSGCSCTSDSQCSGGDCGWDRKCNGDGSGSGSNCSSSSSRGIGCSCDSGNQCSSKYCSSNKCQNKPTTTLTPPPITITRAPIPTIASCNSPTGKPASCTCYIDQQCASGKCTKTSNNPYVGTCSSGPATTAPSPSLSCGLTNRNAGCACETTTQCKTGLTCFNNSCTGANPLSPTPTNGAGETRILLSVGLPGISNITGSGSATPKRLARETKIEVYNASNQKISDKTGNLIYDSASKLYKGTISLGTGFTTGQYIIKVRMDNTLWKRIPGIVTITANTDTNPTTQIQLVTGDIDQNNSLTVIDYTNFVKCFKGEASCTSSMKILADLDDDGSPKDDLDDLTILQKGFAVRDGD